MAKVVSLNTDAPALKTEPPPLIPEKLPDGMFSLEISGDYITFAGQRELRAWRATASNGTIAYSQEFNDKAALFGWLVDTVGCKPEDATVVVDEVVHDEFLPVFMSEDELRQIGFKEVSGTLIRLRTRS